jgi:hypothetical protein
MPLAIELPGSRTCPLTGSRALTERQVRDSLFGMPTGHFWFAPVGKQQNQRDGMGMTDSSVVAPGTRLT